MVSPNSDKPSDTMGSSSKQCALCFLTRKPNPYLIEFALRIHENVQSLHNNVFIMIDDDTYDDNSIPAMGLNLIHVNKDQCIENGFCDCNLIYANQYFISSTHEPLKTLVIAWDKALYYFSRLNTKYHFIWLIEDDVFIPSISFIRRLMEEYSFDCDLVTSDNRINETGCPDHDGNIWYWKECEKLGIPLPWYRSMVCAMGISRRLLIEVDLFAKKHGRLAFLEYIFNTLAMHARLKLYQPAGWSMSLGWDEIWTLDDIKKQRDAWFHPVKDFSLHPQWRNELDNEN